MDDTIERLLARMTVEEKVSMLAGATFWATMPIPRLGIPSMKLTDGPNGARGSRWSASATSACFPVGIALAATWDTELVHRVGMALGQEAKTKGAHILLAPTVNMHRSPLAGRHFECFSEDPYLAGRLAVAYIKGLQSQGVGACIKHFVCNDSEFQRRTISSEVGERALREIYLLPFKMAVEQAQPWAVMSSYNRLNGTHCSENARLLVGILKGEWGFDGIAISDWFGTYSARISNGGLDLEMPGPARWMGHRVLEAVKAGEVGAEVVDDKVRRLLRVIRRAGVIEDSEGRPERSVDVPEHRLLAREAAAEATVLLKNLNGILPLDPADTKSIAVIGENAKWPQIQGGGSASVAPHYVVSPWEGIRNRAGGSTTVGYEIGCTIHRMLPLLDVNWVTTEQGSRKGFTVRFYNDVELSGAPVHSQVTEDVNLVWLGRAVPGVDFERFSARVTGELTVPETGCYTLGLMSAGRSRLFVNGKELIDNWTELPPWGGPEQITQIELSAARSYRIEAEYSWGGGPDWRTLRFGCWPPMPGDPIRRAATLARHSDVAIVFAGLTDEWESEGSDRLNMELPGDQVRLIEEVAAANPNTIVVLNTGSPISMSWLDRVASVVQAWYPGQEAGNAVADVLFGDFNPSGKLPTTFPKRLQDNPSYINFPGENGKVHYGEGIFVGYRYYDMKDIEPLFPFGHGLSYTTFEYSNLTLSTSEWRRGEEIGVSVDVKNTGTRAGKEVIQLYVRDMECSLMRPPKELKAFAKVLLQPGETQKVQFTLDEGALSFYDPAVDHWVAEAGDFEVLVGSSSRDIRLSGRLRLEGDLLPELGKDARLHVGLTLRTLLDDEAAKAVLERYLAPLLQHPQLPQGLDLPLDQVGRFLPDLVTPQRLKAINDDLAAL
jgi:beta-glucosidase